MQKEIDLEKFNVENSKKTIVLIGAGKNAEEILDEQNWCVKFLIDGRAELLKDKFLNENHSLPVYDWDVGISMIEEDDLIVITPSDFDGVIEKFNTYEKVAGKQYYLYIIMKSLQWDKERDTASSTSFNITKCDVNKISKVIHYFWFSGDPFPEKIERCIESWKKYCPDYEIKEWNLNNYKTDNEFCNEALKNRDWAFASDFGRCDVLYKYGGIYLDTDVEIVKNFDDLLYDEGFMCFESKLGIDPGSGMGATPGHHIMSEIRDKYYNISYYNKDGSINHPNIIRMYTDVLEKYGLKLTAEYQQVEGFAIYPPLVMSPYSYMTGKMQQYDRTYSIHHWVSAWVSKKVRKEIDDRKKYFET